MTKKRIRITDGGVALPLGNNTFLMKGRLHSQGGIGIGNGGKNDIEVEDGEVVKFNKDNIQVLSDQPMLNGISPANALLAGGNFNKIFKAQQSINGNHHGSYGEKGLIKRLVGLLTGDDNKKENNEKVEPLNLEELKLRQAYAESAFDSDAKSNKDAMGLFQIRQILLDDYNTANGTNYTLEDLKDDKLNMSIRDWKMDKNISSDWAVRNNAPDSVVYAKALGGYNMGNQNFLNYLTKAKNDGVDIYNSMDWIDEKYLPTETVDYINFILRNKNNSLSRNQLAYETSKRKNADKVEGIRKGFENGGKINMKLKNKNKIDITDIVMNEIFPHSTGERKKFVLGGSEWSLLGNLGANILNGFTQGIIGSINSSRLGKLYDSMKRKSTYVPVAREHIETRVDIEPQLTGLKQAEHTLIENAKANTSNSKVARQQAKSAVANRIQQEHTIYGAKYDKEHSLRTSEAQLQTQYNLADAASLSGDIKDQNDFDMMKIMGKANAKTAEAQAWGQGMANMLQTTGQNLMDYTQMNIDLLKSNNPSAYDQWFSKGYGHLKNKVTNAEWVKKHQDWFNNNKTVLTRLGWITQ